MFLHPSKDTTPLALRQNVRFNNVVHEHVILLSVHAMNVPYVAPQDRIAIDDLIYPHDGIVHLELCFGFQDEQNIPEGLRQATGMSSELDIDADAATFFLSRLSIERGQGTDMTRWRKRLFIGLAHNAANPARAFCLPDDRTVIMGTHLDL